MWELWMHLVYDHLYIPLTSKYGKFQSQTIIFLVKKAYCRVGQDFWKKKFSGLRSCYYRQANRKKLISSLRKYFETLKDMIIGTASI